MEYINVDKNICTDLNSNELDDKCYSITDQVNVSDEDSEEEYVKVNNKEVLNGFKTIMGGRLQTASFMKLKVSYVQYKELQCKQEQISIFDYILKSA